MAPACEVVELVEMESERPVGCEMEGNDANCRPSIEEESCSMGTARRPGESRRHALTGSLHRVGLILRPRLTYLEPSAAGSIQWPGPGISALLRHLGDQPETETLRGSDNFLFGGGGIHQRRNSSGQFLTAD